MNAQLNQMIHELKVYWKTDFLLHGWQLSIERSPKNGLIISTPVYRGDGYVPPAVRQAIQTEDFLEGGSPLRTYVLLDEAAYTVTLYYSGSTRDLSADFAELLEEFTWVAERWWNYLDERDRRDLIFLRVK